MSLYSPEERDEFARTGKRPAYEEVRLTVANLGPSRGFRTRLALVAGFLAFAGLLQLLMAAGASTLVVDDQALALVETAASVSSLTLAIQLWLLRRPKLPTRAFVVAAIAVAGVRAVLGIGEAIMIGRLTGFDVIAPLAACGYGIFLIVQRVREVRGSSPQTPASMR